MQFYRKNEDQLSNVTELEEPELELEISSPRSLVWALDENLGTHEKSQTQKLYQVPLKGDLY